MENSALFSLFTSESDLHKCQKHVSHHSLMTWGKNLSHEFLPNHFNFSKARNQIFILLAIMAAFNGSLVVWVMWIYCCTSWTIILRLLKSHLNAMLYLAAASFKERMKEYDGGGCSMGRKQFYFMRKCIFPRLIAFSFLRKRNIKILQNCFRSSSRALELSAPLNDPFSFRDKI